MTRVAGVGQGGAPRRAARAAAGFAPARTQEGAAPPRVAPAEAAALLALQDAAPLAGQAARLLRRAEAALDGLRGLQLDLLRAEADPARLARLAAMAGAAESAADPALRPLLAELRLRVRVELARRRGSARVPHTAAPVPPAAAEGSPGDDDASGR